MQSPLFDWAYNPTFLSGFLAWMSAGVTKMICFFVRTRQIRPSFLFSTGGMPSAHSSMAGALVTSVAIREGMHTTLFAVTLAFSLVVMFDAQSVRQAAGMQGRCPVVALVPCGSPPPLRFSRHISPTLARSPFPVGSQTAYAARPGTIPPRRTG